MEIIPSEERTLFRFWTFFYSKFLENPKENGCSFRLEIRSALSSDFETPERMFFGNGEFLEAVRFALSRAESFPHQIHFCPAVEVLNAFGEGSGEYCPTGFWADFDDIDSDTFPKLDGLIRMGVCAVVRSGGGIHAYWHSDDIGETRFEALRLGFSKAFGSDPNVTVSHLMRFPCTMNYKYRPARPVRFLYFQEKTVSWKDLFGHVRENLGIEESDTILKRARQRSKNFGPYSPRFPKTWSGPVPSFKDVFGPSGILIAFDALSAHCPLTLKAISKPESLGFREWMTVAAMLWMAFGQSGAELFHEASRLSVRYDPDQTAGIWNYVVSKDFKGWSCATLGIRSESCGICSSHFKISNNALKRLYGECSTKWKKGHSMDEHETDKISIAERTERLRTAELNAVSALFDKVNDL